MDDRIANLVTCWISGSLCEDDCERLLELVSSGQITADELAGMAVASVEAGEYFSQRRRYRKLARRRAWILSAAAACLVALLCVGAKFWLSSSKIYTAGPGETRTVSLNDGSRVVLNSGSSLLVPRNFSAAHRFVTLDGEASFYVRKATSPLLVKTSDNGEITVYGTVFNAKSYSDDSQVEIALSEGSVSYKIDASVRPFTIEPGERIIFDKTAHVVDIDNADIESCFAWSRGELVFSDVSFCDIVNALERKYASRINLSLSDISLMSRHFTCTFNQDDDFASAVSDIAELAGGRVCRDGDRVTICN